MSCGCRTFLPLLLAQDEGHIVNTSSMAALNGHPLGLEPDAVVEVVVEAIRENRFYVLTHPDESFDMVEQQLRWMKTNAPLVPGLGVARTADAKP